MKRQIWKRSLSVLIAASVLLTSSGCADNKTDSVQLSWESDEKDWVSIDASAAKDGEHYIVTLSAGTERFAEDVAKGSVLIKALSHGPESEGAVLVIEDITAFDVEKVSESELKLSFDSSANYEAIHVGVHKDVMESGKYAEAYWSDSSYDVTPVYSANIGGTISEYEKDPVISVKLNGAAPSAELTKDMLTLTDRFSGLEITDVKGEDGTIVISTSGTVEDGDSYYGGVTLSAGATTAGEELSAEIVIAVRSGYLVHDSFAFASGELSFDVAFDNDTFTAAAGEEIVCDDITYTVKAVSADKLTVTLAVAAGAEDIDTAIDMIDNKALVIPATMTGSQSEHIVMLHAVEASVGGYLDYVDEAEAEDTFTATAVLYVKNGEWGELTADDLSFGGDFADATNIELKKDGDSYTVTFDFVYIGADLEETTFDGDITVAHDNMKNEWGSSGDSEYIQLCYLPVSDRDPEIDPPDPYYVDLELPYPSYRDALLDWKASNLQALNDAWSFAKGVGAVGSVISGVQTILGICGVIENTDAKIERVTREILTSLGNLDRKMDSLGAAISANGADVITAVHGTAFNTASLGWNNFLNDYAAPLTKIMNSYNSKYNEYIHDYVNRSGVSHCVTVYIDENGKVTLPGSMTGYSVDGVEIVKEVECLLSAELSDVKSKILKNKDKLYEGYWEDITASDISLIDIDGEPVEDISDDDYFAAVQMDAAMYALNEVGKDNIINAFVNFCNALAGYNAGSSVPKSAVKPLDYYYQMMYYFYNFYSEAKEDISIIRTWLKDTLFKGSAIATLAYTFYPAAQKDIVANAAALAINELSENDGEHNDNYCYIAGKDLSCTEVFPYTSINAKGQVTGSCVSANRTWANPVVFPSTGKFMTETEVALMIRRYEMLKSKSILGTQGTETFGDYLVTRAIMPEAFKNGIVLTSAPSKQPIPLNKKIQLKIQWKHEDSSWFNVNDEVEVGDYGKLSAKHFDTKLTNYWISDTIDLNGTIIKNNMLAAHGLYAESFFIVGSEIYHLEYKNPNSLLIFNLS